MFIKVSYKKLKDNITSQKVEM